ncbi:Hypothetical predicted protein [Cloeon dipterum]|uniref:WAP domain-containing protein n=2 Tax=Cloeon dipterum TaxID=197152 RepID=A0A8S1CPF5_9INSE|nr:Hypothetical predicted protein [Cloeon dipterum]
MDRGHSTHTRHAGGAIHERRRTPTVVSVPPSMPPSVLLLLAAVATVAAAQTTQPQRQPISDEEPVSEFEVGGPHCPPSVSPVSKGLCSMQKCYAHAECQGNGRLCCYNGCVYSCMLKMLPPLVFDWIDEDSDEERGTNETMAEETWSASHQQSSSEEEKDEETEQDKAEAIAPGHVVALPEGCVLTQKDFEQLLVFQKKEYVEKWYYIPLE